MGQSAIKRSQEKAIQRMSKNSAMHNTRMLELFQEGIEHVDTIDAMSVEGFLERLNAEENAP